MFMKMPLARLIVQLALSATIIVTGPEFAAAGDNPTSRVVDVYANSGGAIGTYALRTAKLKKSGNLVRFTGRCDSACTLFLSLPLNQMCITRGAYFRFHAPTHPSPRAAAMAKRYLLRKYPGWVKSFIASRNGLSRQLVTMDYRYASRFIRPCGSVIAKR